MFWGLILKANKKYTQVLEKPFHLSQASLDHSSSDDEPVQVMYSHENSSYLLCTLQRGKVMQCPLDLNFAEGNTLCFLTKGNGIVHLTGFLVADDFDDGEFDSEDDEGSEANDIQDLRKILDKKLKEKVKDKKGKEAPNKKKQPIEESDDEDDDDEDDSDENELEESALLNEEDDDDDDDDDDDEDDEDDDDDEEEDSEDEEEAAPPKAKQAKIDPQQNNKKQQNGISNGQEKKKEKDQKKSKDDQPQKQKQKEGKTNAATEIQKLQGGLTYQDLKVGAGAEAKPGKKIQVYYEGRLKSNNKMFDSTNKGPGFKMTLGRGEVIKGWDVGLVGMKVGGKRRLICPPQMAYGARGNPPVIPQNSTLVFDVELKNVL